MQELRKILKDIPEWDTVARCVYQLLEPENPTEKELSVAIKSIITPKLLFPDDRRRMDIFIDAFVADRLRPR